MHQTKHWFYETGQMNSRPSGRETVQFGCFLPSMRNRSVAGKQKSFVGKYLKVLVKIFLSDIQREVMICLFVGRGTHIIEVRSKKFSSYDIFKVIYLSSLHAYHHHSGRLGLMVARVQIPLDLSHHARSPPLPPPWWKVFGSAPAILVAATPSLVIWEAGEGSEARYLIKADWDLQWMHIGAAASCLGGLLLMQHPKDKSHIWGLSICRLSFLIHYH